MKLVRLLVVLAALLPAGAGFAAEVEGVKLPDRIKLSDAAPELILNGAGVRTRIFIKVYVGALYLQSKTAVADAVLAGRGAETRRAAPAARSDIEQLLSGFNDGLRDNHTPEQLAQLEPKIKEFSVIFNSMKAVRNGDVIHLDYSAPAGTRVTVNGDSKGAVAGEDFHKALLRIWLGNRPSDSNLKKAMLGG
jgi:long-chain acyl-CoA synthetase